MRETSILDGSISNSMRQWRIPRINPGVALVGNRNYQIWDKHWKK